MENFSVNDIFETSCRNIAGTFGSHQKGKPLKVKLPLLLNSTNTIIGNTKTLKMLHVL